MTGYEPGSLHSCGEGQYRVGVGLGDLCTAIGDHVAACITEHNEHFADTDPSNIHISAIHIEPENPSYIEFWVDN